VVRAEGTVAAVKEADFSMMSFSAAINANAIMTMMTEVRRRAARGPA